MAKKKKKTEEGNQKTDEGTVYKMDEIVSKVDKTDENASIVKSTEEVTETVDEKVDEKVDEPVDKTVDEPVEEQKVEYVFPKVPECPRCKTHDNEAYRTDGKVQYRKCRRGHCRHRWHVIGVKKK